MQLYGFRGDDVHLFQEGGGELGLLFDRKKVEKAAKILEKVLDLLGGKFFLEFVLGGVAK